MRAETFSWSSLSDPPAPPTTKKEQLLGDNNDVDIHGRCGSATGGRSPHQGAGRARRVVNTPLINHDVSCMTACRPVEHPPPASLLRVIVRSGRIEPDSLQDSPSGIVCGIIVQGAGAGDINVQNRHPRVCSSTRPTSGSPRSNSWMGLCLESSLFQREGSWDDVRVSSPPENNMGCGIQDEEHDSMGALEHGIVVGRYCISANMTPPCRGPRQQPPS